MHRVVFIRHGESEYNVLKKCAGWLDCRLTFNGILQARGAGQMLRSRGYAFDAAFSSVLKRAVDTRCLLLDEMGLSDIETHQSWRLNERHYGGLDDLTRDEAELKYGEETFRLCREDFGFRPPLATGKHVDCFGGGLADEPFPNSESMNDVTARCVDYWQNVIVPVVSSGKRAIVVAHGEILRLLMGHLLEASEEEIVCTPVLPNARPCIFDFRDDFSVSAHYLLGDSTELTPAAVGPVDAIVE